MCIECELRLDKMCTDTHVQVSVNMPSIEVGTIGGGTSLPGQAACLDIIGCRGATRAPGCPGDNAQQMAKYASFFS